MTAADFKAKFLLICDKVGSPYFSDSEIESFINTAQFSVIDTLLFPQRKNQEKKDKDIFEFEYQNSMQQGLQALRMDVVSAISTGSTLTFIALAVVASATPYKVIGIQLPPDEIGGTPQYSAKYVGTTRSSASIYKNLRFGTSNSPKYGTYTVEGSVIKWTPELTVADEIAVEFIRVPLPFSIAGNQTCEVDAIYHNEILFRALQLAGINMREADFYEMTNIEQAKEA